LCFRSKGGKASELAIHLSKSSLQMQTSSASPSVCQKEAAGFGLRNYPDHLPTNLQKQIELRFFAIFQQLVEHKTAFIDISDLTTSLFFS
jgi:hypothetical protein